MDNNFSAQVKEIISFSREEALRLGNDFIGTEHLLLGLIREGDNTAVRILKSFNVDLYELRKEIELAVKDKTGKNIANINSLPLTKQAEKVIRITVLEAKAQKSALVESEHLMLSILKNKENIATMKKGSYLINTARGAIVETEALVGALQNGTLAGAGLDVLEEEGDMADETVLLTAPHPNEGSLKVMLENHYLIDHPRVIVTPHVAFNTTEAVTRIIDTTVDNIQKFAAGTPANVVA
jgi:hypothetical protein